jgi:hypothetical protein
VRNDPLLLLGLNVGKGDLDMRHGRKKTGDPRFFQPVLSPVSITIDDPEPVLLLVSDPVSGSGSYGRV